MAPIGSWGVVRYSARVSALGVGFAVLLALGAPAQPALAPVSFSGPTHFPAGTTPTSVAVGDFNRDSDPDLAVANEGSDNLSVLLGGPGGSFSSPSQFAVGNSPRSVAVADFNGDSDPDLAVANANSSDVSVLFGGTGGSFSGALNLPMPVGLGGNLCGPLWVAVGDFNQDSDPDLAVACAGTNRIHLLLGGPGGLFFFEQGPSVSFAPRSIVVGDFNQDSDPDLAVTRVLASNVVILLGSIGASFSSPTEFWGGSDPGQGTAGDFNEDGDPDLAFARGGPRDTVSVLLGQAGGAFSGPGFFDVHENNAASVAVGDFNEDSHQDLAVTRSGSEFLEWRGSGVTILPGFGDGTFSSFLAGDFQAGNGPVGVAVDDFDGNSKPDIVTANLGSHNVSVLLDNAFPIAANESYSTVEDAPVSVAAPGVLANDTDADDDRLSAVLADGPSAGTLALSPDGSFTYTPNADFFGTDTFTYMANDGAANSNVATVTITVTSVNTDPPVAINDSYSTPEDTPLSVAAPGVLANDTDADGDTLSACCVDEPANGSLTLASNGSFNYTPRANFSGTDTFLYRANDGRLSSNLATVTITVTAVNDPPMANDDAVTTLSGVRTTINVLANDSDVDDDTLTVTGVTSPANGTATVNADNTVTYRSTCGFQGVDRFAYVITDGKGGADPGTVTVQVRKTSRRPSAGC